MRTKQKVAQVGCDCHRMFSRITARSEDGEIVWRQRLEHGDRAKLREQLSSWPKGTPVILEGTFGWGWLCDEMLAAGLDPHLANSTKIAAWRKARGSAKSDRLDADLLSELWSQRPRWWEVWLAPPEVRDQREWLRYRMSLVKTQTAVKNRIHAVLHRHGIIHEFSDLFGTAGRRFLSLLIASCDARLPESGRLTLKGHLQLLDQLRRQIASATRAFRTQALRSTTAMRLRTLPGICWILGYTINAEIGDIGRFRSPKHLCSYSLLAPRANDSGLDPEDDGVPMGRHVGHVGRRTLKWARIEAAHGAVRKGGRFRTIFDRYTDGGKRNRNRGYIVVAHELCRIAYVLLKKEIDYDASALPARPGSKKKTKKKNSLSKKSEKMLQPSESRPGTGQPHRPMVAAVV
jgi:transposase